MPATEEILGDETPSDAVMGTVRGAVQSNEPILGIVVTSEGDALVATEQRLLIATEAELVLDTGYEDITDLEVRTGWWSRGITLKTSEAEFECDIDDRDAATAMGTIIGDRAPGLDPDDTGEDGGGLMGRARGCSTQPPARTFGSSRSSWSQQPPCWSGFTGIRQPRRADCPSWETL